MKKNRRLIYINLTIYTIYLLVIVGGHWLFGGHFGELHRTISRHVGYEWWSSIFFAICNFIIITLTIIYMIKLKYRSVLWWLTGAITIIGFVGLSIFPCQLYPLNSDLGWITEAHLSFAKIMFVGMLLMALVALFKVWGTKWARFTCIFFILYSVHYMIAYNYGFPYFENYVLIWETLYIYLYQFVLLAASARQPKNLETQNTQSPKSLKA